MYTSYRDEGLESARWKNYSKSHIHNQVQKVVGKGVVKKSWEQNVKKGFFKNVPGNPVPSHFAMSFVCIV